MKILCIHSNFITYEAKSEIKGLAEAVDDDKKTGEMEEALVVFAAVEKPDEEDPKGIVREAQKEIEHVLNLLKTENVLIYPYAHLSSDLSKSRTAVEILKDLEAALSKKFTVKRAPFGYYKSFVLSCKGHPLSELSKEIHVNPVKEVKTREDITKSIKKEYYVLTPEGEEFQLHLTDSDLQTLDEYPSLKQFILSEEIGNGPSQEPPSFAAMRNLELVNHEIASDSGNFRFYPKGDLMFELLKDWAFEIAVERFGAVKIETPILYDWSNDDIRSQGESFHERHYIVRVPDDPKKEFVLRFAGDFGLFRMMKEATLSYKHLPLRIYEFSKSFRYEQKGELSGLKRLRAFHMPDVHCFTADLEQGWKEYQQLYKQYDDLLQGIGIEYVVAFRIVKEFYEKFKERIIEMLQYSQKPAFIEVLSEMKHYWAVKHEFNNIDSVGGGVQLSTVQLDVEDAERYGITYTNGEGKEVGCIICHSSVGSIERLMFSILEEALKMENPVLPLWLSPTQVRVIPVNSHRSIIDHCANVLTQFETAKIRADLDDREMTLSRKIRAAELEWIPYVVVVGEQEMNNGFVSVRTRASASQRQMPLREVVAEIGEQTEGMPFRKIPLPELLSKRPIFYGYT